ncbi:MAG: hypothetical protein CMJ18_09605 [Phycisphaeraceae bacterium]|nr:hypothetical protein [Phycisphaeraceae bacterium]
MNALNDPTNPPSERGGYLGAAELEPRDAIVAGAVGQWTVRYTVGEAGIDEGGTIKLAKRFASDWETPQFDQPGAPGYATVRTDGDAKLSVRFAKKAHERPWMNWCILIDVHSGFLSPGNRVTIVLGDRSEGSPGIRAQTFVETRHDFRVFVDPTNAAVARSVPGSPTVPIIAGDAVELVCVVPTRVTVGEPARIRVRGQDRWMNPTSVPDGVRYSWEGDGTVDFAGDTMRFGAAGSGYVRAEAGGLVSRSNPVAALETEPAPKRYWGDLHAQSDATVGTGTEEEYFRFCRDRAFLDFASHQGNDFQMDDEDWARLTETVKAFNERGRFVVLPGYEWSANTPAGGDRNVFYCEDDQPIFRSSHWQIPDVTEDARTPAHPASELSARIRENGKAILAAHVGGRYADIRKCFDQEICPLVEVLSCWGVFEWMLWDAFDMGYVVGVMANSDGHKGRPGAEGPGAGDFGIAGGLTCVLADDLTRQAVFAALKQRRCYGTSGPRIDLAFSIDDQPMGSVITGAEGPLDLRAHAVGTNDLESLQLYEGREIVEVVHPPAFSNLGDTRRVRVSWQGARIRGRARRVDWSGVLRVEGAGILSAETVSFDSPADGITERGETEIAFRSRTTGDMDGIDILLDDPAAARVTLECAEGRFTAETAELRAGDGRRTWELGELDRRVTIHLYPEEIARTQLSLARQIQPPVASRTPYFVKAIQADGHAAWSSPVYVERT